MRVLTIIETLGKGGAERVLVNTLPNLLKHGIQCEVAILFERDDLAVELEAQNIKVHRLNLSNKWNVFEALVKINQLVKHNKFDIVHAHLFFAHFYTGLLSIFNKQYKSVVTFHNLGYNTFPADTPWRKARKMMDSFVVNKLIDKKVAVSTAVKKHYSQHLKIEIVDLIFNAFPITSILKQLEVEIEPLTLNRRYDLLAITPGRIVKEKGHLFLIDAIVKLNEHNPNIGYLIVGDGPLMPQIKQVVLDKKIDNIYLQGEVSHQRMLELIKISDLVISSSISEGFPMVIGEAMILAKPIVATNVGGTPDFIDDGLNGLLVNSKDSVLLAKTVLKLINDKNLRLQLAENAATKVGEFDIEKIGFRWKAYYEDLIK